MPTTTRAGTGQSQQHLGCHLLPSGHISRTLDPKQALDPRHWYGMRVPQVADSPNVSQGPLLFHWALKCGRHNHHHNEDATFPLSYNVPAHSLVFKLLIPNLVPNNTPSVTVSYVMPPCCREPFVAGLFYLALCFRHPFILLSIAAVIPFVFCSVVTCYLDVPRLVYPFTGWKALGVHLL